MKTRKPKLTQHIPDGPEPMFQVVDRVPGLNYWEIRIQDDQVPDDRPIFRYQTPKSGCPFTVREIALAGFGECTEGRGLVTVQEVLDGIPTATFVFVGNGRQVFCVRSSDTDRQGMVDARGIHGRAMTAIREAQDSRRKKGRLIRTDAVVTGF